VLGYLSLRLELDPSPLMLGFILGPMLEENFRRAMLLSGGSFMGFVTRPVSGTLLALIGLFVIWQVVSVFVSSRRAALQLSSEL
jgi:TctA family transporter